MQRSIHSKALSLLLAALLCLSVFAAVEIAIPRAHAVGDVEFATPSVTTPGVTLSTRNSAGLSLNANYTQISYMLSVSDGEMFTGETCNWPLTTNDVTITKAGGEAIRPTGIRVQASNGPVAYLNLYFPANLAAGEYTVSIADIEGVAFTFGNDYVGKGHETITVLPRSAKPVITFGLRNEHNEVDVTISATDTNGITPDLMCYINDEWYETEGENPFTFQISPTTTNPYPVKYIDVYAYGNGLLGRRAVDSYAFVPAAGAFQVAVTPATAYQTKTIDGDVYRLIATLSSQNGSGAVTYALDQDYNYEDFVIDGNEVYVWHSYGSDSGSGSGSSWKYYENGTFPEWVDEGDYFRGYIPYIIATDASGAVAYANTLISYGEEDEPYEPGEPGEPEEPGKGGNSGNSGKSSSSRSSGGSSGYSGSNNTTSSTPAPSPVNSAAAVQNVKDAIAAAKTSANGASVTLKNVTTVSLDTLKQMAKAAGNTALKVNADSLNPDGTVDVRITIDPSKATSGINLSASTTSAAAKSAEMRFEKHFDNTISAVSLSQKGSFGMPVRVAAKIDPKLNTGTLVFYSYDSATNTFTKIENPQYTVDKNGYVHFTTSVGGEIIISDKPLTRK